ncbi:MAG: proline--tRNA ligase [Chloroflexota bacterium]
MRMSKLFFHTLREVPADAEIVSHQLMLRTGMIAQLASGIFDYMPLGYRVKRKVEQIIREEMDAIGGQEVSLTVVHPAEIWKQTGRWYEIGDDMARLQDRHGRDMCLAMTHEEVMAHLAKQVIRSYRQLPVMLYQFQTKFRDEPRPRAGMIRVREFTMKDAYTFDTSFETLDQFYPKTYQAYFDIFRRCGLDVIAVESDTGMMGGTMAHEFMALADIGEDTLLICSKDGCYSANRQIAVFQKPEPPTDDALPLEEVHTPGVNTIASLAEFLDIPESQTAKAVFMIAEVDGEENTTAEVFVFAVVRGDMDVNETKLSNAVKARSLRPATTEEINAIGAETGYGSPVGISRDGVVLVVDDLVASSPNLVAGANKVDYHYLNVNCGRDYEADVVTDIVSAADGYPCPNCGSPLYSVRGVEVGNIFKLGTKYSAAMGATYLDDNGREQPIVMGSYGIGSGRLIACVIERHNDEQGIKWPISVAPYHISLVSLANKRSPEVIEAADKLYAQLTEAGHEVLYDDRDERAGVKFNDAELLGIPIRLTVGGRGLKNGVLEYSIRRTGEKGEIALDSMLESVQGFVDAEWAVIQALMKTETM